MNTKNILGAALLATGLAVAAHAQINVQTGDLVLGFRQAGNSQDLLVDLGQASVFENATSTINLSPLFAASDLTSTFGSSWATSNNVKWGVFGATYNGDSGSLSVASDTLWSTSANGSIARQVDVNQNLPAGGIFTMTYASLYGATPITSGGADVHTSSANGTFGYTDSITLGGTALSDWGYFNTNVVEGVGPGSLALYEMQPTATGTAPGTLLGTFTLGSNGAFSFSPFAAIPEPSTYAGILGVVTLGIVAIRRRRQAAAAV